MRRQRPFALARRNRRARPKRLSLKVPNRVGAAAGEWLYVILPVAGTPAACVAGRWARMLALELPLARSGRGSSLRMLKGIRNKIRSERLHELLPPLKRCEPPMTLGKRHECVFG
jgi:hypothetical protein